VVGCNVRKLKALQMHQLQRRLQHSACGQHSGAWFNEAVCERWQPGRWFICRRVQVLVGGSVVAIENSKGQNKGGGWEESSCAHTPRFGVARRQNSGALVKAPMVPLRAGMLLKSRFSEMALNAVCACACACCFLCWQQSFLSRLLFS
jgi:hypothetical protein